MSMLFQHIEDKITQIMGICDDDYKYPPVVSGRLPERLSESEAILMIRTLCDQKAWDHLLIHEIRRILELTHA